MSQHQLLASQFHHTSITPHLQLFNRSSNLIQPPSSSSPNHAFPRLQQPLLLVRRDHQHPAPLTGRLHCKVRQTIRCLGLPVGRFLVDLPLRCHHLYVLPAAVASIYTQLTCLRDPALAYASQPTRGHSAFIVPMHDEEIELYHITRSPPPSFDDEDVTGHEAYRQLLATRPLPPLPVASPPRRRAAFPTLLSPLSDPFIERGVAPDHAGFAGGEARRTIRLVPASSGMLCPESFHGRTLLTTCAVISRI